MDPVFTGIIGVENWPKISAQRIGVEAVGRPYLPSPYLTSLFIIVPAH